MLYQVVLSLCSEETTMNRSASLLGMSSLLLLWTLTQADAQTPLQPAPKGFDAKRDNIERGVYVRPWTVTAG